jgi:hypothetical protein
VIAQGKLGDFIVRISGTDQIRSIMKKKKDTRFLSVEAPEKYISDGYCLLNVVPRDTIKAQGIPAADCSYRLFCGAESDMETEEMYAIELCK